MFSGIIERHAKLEVRPCRIERTTRCPT